VGSNEPVLGKLINPMVRIAMGMISPDRLDLPDDLKEISQKVFGV
jgi:hypothetical protein